MDTIVQESFDSIEASLANLIESISSYNPSPPAAIAVVNADDALTECLEQLDEHQQSYQKILSLRATSEALDKQLTGLLDVLSEARKEVLSVPVTRFPLSHEVPYDELLMYASKISKYTCPPQFSKYTHVPTTDNTSVSADMNNVNNGGDSAHVDYQTIVRSLPLGLSEEEVSALDPSSQTPFTPWPSEEVMKRGALSQMGYEGELRAKGLPVPDVFQNMGSNSQGTDLNTEPVQSVPVRIEAVAVQSQRHGRPREHPLPGVSLSLDLYDPNEDKG